MLRRLIEASLDRNANLIKSIPLLQSGSLILPEMIAQQGIARSVGSALRVQQTQTRLFSAGRILAEEESSKPLGKKNGGSDKLRNSY